jgi:hypothetical protein
MQLRGTMCCPLIALHVSSDIFAHHQELLNCIFTAYGDTYRVLTLPRHQQAVTYLCITRSYKSRVYKLLIMSDNIAQNI